MIENVRRGHLKIGAGQGWRAAAELELTSGEQGVTVAVEQEIAVDSYNQEITCQKTLTRAEAEALRDWLNAVLAP